MAKDPAGDTAVSSSKAKSIPLGGNNVCAFKSAQIGRVSFGAGSELNNQPRATVLVAIRSSDLSSRTSTILGSLVPDYELARQHHEVDYYCTGGSGFDWPRSDR